MTTSLAVYSRVAGAFCVLCGLSLLLAPGQTRTLAQRFPRNRIAGWLLTGVDLAWAGWFLYNATFLAELPLARRLVIILMPVVFLLIVFLLDELLASRALGGLLLLIPQPILSAAYLHPSRMRLIMTVLAYVLAVLGMILVLSPYRLRQWTTGSLMRTDRRTRISGAVLVNAGLCLVCLGMMIY
ncbi:MAG: DUF2065 family protein [Lentisphaerales bacterium]|nr:MAG: DUF2065 family protein [Lentisphaerales bacterium]